MCMYIYIYIYICIRVRTYILGMARLCHVYDCIVCRLACALCTRAAPHPRPRPRLCVRSTGITDAAFHDIAWRLRRACLLRFTAPCPFRGKDGVESNGLQGNSPHLNEIWSGAEARKSRILVGQAAVRPRGRSAPRARVAPPIPCAPLRSLAHPHVAASQPAGVDALARSSRSRRGSAGEVSDNEARRRNDV